MMTPLLQIVTMIRMIPLHIIMIMATIVAPVVILIPMTLEVAFTVQVLTTLVQAPLIQAVAVRMIKLVKEDFCRRTDMSQFRGMSYLSTFQTHFSFVIM